MGTDQIQVRAGISRFNGSHDFKDDVIGSGT